MGFPYIGTGKDESISPFGSGPYVFDSQEGFTRPDSTDAAAHAATQLPLDRLRAVGTPAAVYSALAAVWVELTVDEQTDAAAQLAAYNDEELAQWSAGMTPPDGAVPVVEDWVVAHPQPLLAARVAAKVEAASAQPRKTLLAWLSEQRAE